MLATEEVTGRDIPQVTTALPLPGNLIAYGPARMRLHRPRGAGVSFMPPLSGGVMLARKRDGWARRQGRGRYDQVDQVPACTGPWSGRLYI